MTLHVIVLLTGVDLLCLHGLVVTGTNWLKLELFYLSCKLNLFTSLLFSSCPVFIQSSFGVLKLYYSS